MDKHVHFAGAFRRGDLDADGKRVQVYGQGLPGAAKTFLEGYSDSPEFSRVQNPVVHSDQDADDDDDDYIGPSKFANYLSPMDRQRADPLEFRRMASLGAYRRAYTNTSGISKSHDEDIIPTQSANIASQASNAEGSEDLMDEDDEEPEDDTFEFLMK